MNKTTINWTDNKVMNSNTGSQQRPSQTANEQYYMDTMPTRPMQNMNTYSENMQNVQGVQNMPNSPNTQGVQGAKTVKTPDSMNHGSTAPIMPSQTMPQMQYQDTMPMQQVMPQVMPQGRNDFYLAPVAPISFEQGPPPVMDKNYIAGYLASNIGKNIRAEFAISTGLFLDKAGVLREVGVNYFVLQDYISKALVMCDLYSVKFVTIL